MGRGGGSHRSLRPPPGAALRAYGNVVAVTRPCVFEFAGGQPAFLALATAHHERCLADPVLQHPFSHGGHPQHIERLGHYWAEVFGGPDLFSQESEGQTGLLGLHAGMEAQDDLGDRFVACFVHAIDDAHLPDDADFRRVLRHYMEWAVRDVHTYNPRGSTVPVGLAVPRWTWDGLVPPDVTE
jgi:hemoglobin